MDEATALVASPRPLARPGAREQGRRPPKQFLQRLPRQEAVAATRQVVLWLPAVPTLLANTSLTPVDLMVVVVLALEMGRLMDPSSLLLASADNAAAP